MYDDRYRRDRENPSELIEKLLKDLHKPPWKDISKTGGHADNFSKKLNLKTTQLRKFFDSVKNINDKLASGKNWEDVEGEAWRIIPALKYAKARGLCDDHFVKFVEEGLRKVSEAPNKKEAFMNFSKIFEAVVAYFKYHNPKK